MQLHPGLHIFLINTILASTLSTKATNLNYYIYHSTYQLEIALMEKWDNVPE